MRRSPMTLTCSSSSAARLFGQRVRSRFGRGSARRAPTSRCRCRQSRLIAAPARLLQPARLPAHLPAAEGGFELGSGSSPRTRAFARHQLGVSRSSTSASSRLSARQVQRQQLGHRVQTTSGRCAAAVQVEDAGRNRRAAGRPRWAVRAPARAAPRWHRPRCGAGTVIRRRTALSATPRPARSARHRRSPRRDRRQSPRPIRPVRAAHRR